MAKDWITDSTVKKILQSYRLFVTHLNLRGCTSLQWPSLRFVSKCSMLDLRWFICRCAMINAICIMIMIMIIITTIMSQTNQNVDLYIFELQTQHR